MNFYALIAVLAVIGSSTSFLLDPIDEYIDNDRIENGTTARPGQFPYMVSVRHQVRLNNTIVWRHRCGGSIISNRWVLSAAHCFQRTNQLTVQIFVGAHHFFNDGRGHNVGWIVNHPQFNGSTLANDVSLLQSASPFQLNNRVRIIPLRRQFVGGSVATVISGWGLSWNTSEPTHPFPSHLQFLRQDTLTNDQCRARHVPQNWGLITNGTICVFARRYQGLHGGDSGSPTVVNGQQIGIAKWAVGPRARGFPEGLERISAHVDWIEEISGVIAV